MMSIHSGNVIGDNLWLWRADHSALGLDEISNFPEISQLYWQTESNEYRVQTGLTVTGNNVTLFGLAVEHANGNQTVWSGESGAVYFYQSELSYDTRCIAMNVGTSDEKTVCNDDDVAEYRGFLIEPHVQEHEIYAPGVYSNFRNDAVYVTMAIEHPRCSHIQVVNAFTVKLDNLGGICSIVNGKGKGTDCPGIPVRN
jgi:hypothetical protein